MRITDIRFRHISKDSKMRAVVSVTLDNELVIHDIKVIYGKRGFFIGMPSQETKMGKFRDVVHPINTSVRQRIQDVIVESYIQAIQGDSS